MDPAPSIFVRQHERHHGRAVIARPRNRLQRYEPHPLCPAPGGRVDRLVWPQCRISNDAVEVEQQVARINVSGRDFPLDGRMEHPNHIPEPAFQALIWWQVRIFAYWPHVAMKCCAGHRQRPLEKLAAHLTHWSLLAIDQDAVLNRLPARVDVDYFNRVVTRTPRLVMAVHGSARR